MSTHLTVPDGFLLRLGQVDGVVLDIDGCLVLSDRPGGHGGRALPGAAETLEAIRASGRRVVLFTNASSQIPARLAESLRSIGIDVSHDEVLTPAVVMAELLVERYGDQPVLAFGGPGLIDVLTAAGVHLADPAHPEAAVAVAIGWDTNFDHDRLQCAAEAVWNGASLLVTSDAKRFAAKTRPMAGLSGFIAQGLSYVTGATYEVCGKPAPAAMRLAAERLDTTPSHILVIGDDLTLEVSMARAAGATGLLVTTGIHTLRDAYALPADQRPDLVLAGIVHLVPLLLRADSDDYVGGST